MQYVIADKGYDVLEVRNLIRRQYKIPVIPRKANAPTPGLREELKEIYKSRSAIERFFGAIKENKRMVVRFDKMIVLSFHFSLLHASKS